MKNKLLSCGHPSGPNHLTEDGKCGNCKLINDWKEMSQSEDKTIAKLSLKMFKFIKKSIT